MGVGMVAVVPPDAVDAAMRVLAGRGLRAWVCGSRAPAGSGTGSASASAGHHPRAPTVRSEGLRLPQMGVRFAALLPLGSLCPHDINQSCAAALAAADKCEGVDPTWGAAVQRQSRPKWPAN